MEGPASQLLLGRGVATGVVATTVSPLYSGRLRSLALTAPFTADDAQAVWSALKTAKIIDENSYPTSTPSAATVGAALPAAYKARAADIAAEIAVAAAEREFFSEGNSRVINFLNARATDAAAPTPGRLVNLSTRGSVAFLGDGLIEGEQHHGWIELMLTTRFPDRAVTFRNLGWSADLPNGESRLGLSLRQAGVEILFHPTIVE